MPTVFFSGLVVFSLVIKHVAPIHIGDDELRVEVECFPIFSSGLAVVPLLCKYIAPQVIGGSFRLAIEWLTFKDALDGQSRFLIFVPVQFIDGKHVRIDPFHDGFSCALDENVCIIYGGSNDGQTASLGSLGNIKSH